MGRRWTACLLAVGMATPVWGQAADTAMPSDPVELLTAAAKVNGLVGAEMRPWHLKATFESLDDSGKVKETGTFEEWWVSDSEWRSSYTSGGYTQTAYHTEKGMFLLGDQGPRPTLALEMTNEISSPFGGVNFLRQLTWVKDDTNSKPGRMTCIKTTYEKRADLPVAQDGREYCFEATRPMLRISAPGRGRGEILHNSLVQFQGRYLARELNLVVENKTLYRAHVELVEGLSSVVDAEFEPPPDAKVYMPKVILSAAVAQGQMIRPPQPVYPPHAKAAHVEGVVVIEATIGRDGHLHDPVALSGPEELRPAALEAAKYALYKPYLLNGVAVEVATTMNIIFRLGYYH